MIHTIKGFKKIKCAHAGGGAIVYITLDNVSNTVDRMSATQILFKSKLMVRCCEKHRIDSI